MDLAGGGRNSLHRAVLGHIRREVAAESNSALKLWLLILDGSGWWWWRSPSCCLWGRSGAASPCTLSTRRTWTSRSSTSRLWTSRASPSATRTTSGESRVSGESHVLPVSHVFPVSDTCFRCAGMVPSHLRYAFFPGRTQSDAQAQRNLLS